MASIVTLDSSSSSSTSTDALSVAESVQVKHEELNDTSLRGPRTHVGLDKGDLGILVPKVGSNQTARRLKGHPINPESLCDYDQIIMNMKEERRPDKEIAEHLEQNGYIAYKPKTITTRYARLRKKIADYRDEQLDKGEVIWDPANDPSLIESVVRVRRDIAKMQVDAEAKLWHTVSERLHKTDRTLNFSSRACRERHEKIMLGNLDIYPELKDLNLDHDITSTRDTLFRAKHAHQEAERKADFKALQVAVRYRDRAQTSSALSRQTVPSYYVVDQDDASDCDQAEDHTASSTVKVNTVSRQTNHATNLKRQSHEEAEQQLAIMQLPSPEVMDREEIEAEMAVRGYEARGDLNALRANVLLARKGKTDFPRAKAPRAISEFKKLLAEKRVWEYDSDETIEDKTVVGIHDEDTITRTSYAATQEAGIGNPSLKRSFVDSDSDSEKTSPLKRGYGLEHHAKKLRIDTTDQDEDSAMDADDEAEKADKVVDTLRR